MIAAFLRRRMLARPANSEGRIGRQVYPYSRSPPGPETLNCSDRMPQIFRHLQEDIGTNLCVKFERVQYASQKARQRQRTKGHELKGIWAEEEY